MIRKLHRASDPELDAQLDLILKHGHDDKYSLLKHLHDDKYSLLKHLHDERYPLKATTLAGYGITDTYTKAEADSNFAPKSILDTITALSDTVDTLSAIQTWTDVTASRAINVTYTNTTGRPIFVYVSRDNIGNTFWFIYINDIKIGHVNGYGNANGMGFVVPPEATYKVDGGQSLRSWFELR